MVNAGVNPIFVLGQFAPQKQREDHPAGLEEDDLLAVIEDLHGLRSHTSKSATALSAGCLKIRGELLTPK